MLRPRTDAIAIANTRLGIDRNISVIRISVWSSRLTNPASAPSTTPIAIAAATIETAAVRSKFAASSTIENRSRP